MPRHPNHPTCGAKTHQETSKEFCTLSAGWGTDHPGIGRCKLHGGSTPNQKTNAAKIQADREVRKVLAELEVDPVEDPLTALMQLAGQVVSWQKATAVLVNRLGDEVRYEGMAGGEQLRAEVPMYERAMDRAEKVLSSIARLDIETRLAAISEAQADRVLGAIDAVLAHLGVTGTDAAQAKQVAARHLRAV